MPPRSVPELEPLQRVLGKVPGLELALLFGSVARGDARNDSDVDVAVMGQGLDLAEISARISDATGRDAHVLHLEQATIPLLEELLAEGIVISERPGRAAMWRSHTLADLELDRPWYHRQRDAWLAREAGRGAR